MDPGAWERHGVSLTTARGVCELLPVECYFLAPGLSQRWYVKVQSIASVTSVLPARFSIGLCFGRGCVSVRFTSSSSPSAEQY